MSKTVRVFGAALAMLAMVGVAQAQLTPIDPFVGDLHDGFEVGDHPNYACPPCFYPCLPDGMFLGRATFCAEGASEHITGGWSFGCGISPHGGSRLEGNTGGISVITFDPVVGKFGGFWGTNNPQAPDAEFVFTLGNGDQITLPAVEIPNNCTWTWHGWEAASGIKSIRIRGLSGFGHIMKDDMEASESGGGHCQYKVTKSKAKGNCGACPAKNSNWVSQSSCEEVGDCTKKVKTTINCPSGPGTCAIKGKRNGCV
jgi:hypothetical protein